MMTVEGGCKIGRRRSSYWLQAPIGSQNELEHNFHELKTFFSIMSPLFTPLSRQRRESQRHKCLENFLVYFGIFLHRVANAGGGNSIPKIIKHEKPRGFVYRKHTKRKITHLSRAMIKT